MSKSKHGSGIFDDIANGIVSGIKLLGGRIAVLEDHLDVPELEHHEYLEKFAGSGFENTLWDTAKTALKHPVTKQVLTAAIPIAIKVLAGRVAHLEEHMDGSGYKIAGKATKNKGGAYAIEEGGDYAVAGATKKKRGGAYATAGDEEAIAGAVASAVAGATKKKRGGNLGATETSKPPVHQRAIMLTDLLE